MEVKLFQGVTLLFQATNVRAITVRLQEAGEITVLNDHIALLGSIIPGKIIIQTAGGKQTFVLQTGVFCFLNNQAKILTAGLKNDPLPL